MFTGLSVHNGRGVESVDEIHHQPAGRGIIHTALGGLGVQHRVEAELAQPHIGGHHHHPPGEGVEGLHADDNPGPIVLIRGRFRHGGAVLGDSAVVQVHVHRELRDVLVGVKGGAAAGLGEVDVLASRVADVLFVTDGRPSGFKPPALSGQNLQRLAIAL